VSGDEDLVGIWPSDSLPAGWAWADFTEVFTNVTSSHNKLKQADYAASGRLAVVDQGTALVGGYCDRPELAYSGGLPVIVFGDHTRCVKFVEVPFVQGADGVKVLRPAWFLDPRFGYHALRAIALPNKGYSRHFKFLASSSVPLPPLPEQRRIVAKIEELTAHSRRAREALEAIPPLLEKLRQSILAAAFSGRLTADWRAQHPDVEPASKLLERIRTERRRRWEESELAKLRAKNKEPKDDTWKRRYKEPEPVDTTDLPELPEEWCWCRWSDLTQWVTYGFTRPMPHVEEGIPIVTAKNVVGGRLSLNDVHYTTAEAFEGLSDKDRPRPGDILVTKDGTIGRAAIVRDYAPFCINQSVAVVWLRSCPVNRDYLLRVIESPMTQEPINERARGMALQHLSITDFAALPVPLAPQEEQEQLVATVNRWLTSVATLGGSLKVGQEHLHLLDQSVLSEAFRGELVPQDPNDEPASALLERIRTEREAAGHSSPRRRRSTDTPPSTTPPVGAQHVAPAVDRSPAPTLAESHTPIPHAAPHQRSLFPDHEDPDESRGDTLARVLQFLRAHPGPLSRREILTALAAPEASWPELARALADHPAVERSGQKRGTRYRYREEPRR